MLVLLLASTTVTVAQDYPVDADALSLIWEQIGAQPDDVAIGCVPLYDPANAVFYNADEPFPLASITKLLVFIEYARRLDAGEITFRDVVNAREVERYNLPRTDRGAHDRFMEQYSPDVLEITLWELALGMVQYSSNAASDYILNRLEPVDWGSLFQTLSVTDTDEPHSLTMIPLLMNNHETGRVSLSDVGSLSIEQGEAYLDLFVEDEAWRAAEIEHRSGRGSQFPAWNIQSAVLQEHTATGTVNDWLNVMRAIYTDNGALSENVKSWTRLAMLWSGNEFLSQWYLEYGSKLGFYSGGTLALVAYGNPYVGDPVISAAFFRNIPRSRYSELLDLDAIGSFAHWMHFTGCSGLRDSLPYN